MANWVRTPAVAKHVVLSVHTVYKLVQSRAIPFGRAGGRLVFDLDEIDRWIRERGSAGALELPGEQAARAEQERVDQAQALADRILTQT